MATSKQDNPTTATTKLILSSYQPSGAANNTIISPHLKELVLHDSSSSMTDEEVDILCKEILMKRSSLTRLTLDLRECSDEGMRHIAELIEKTKTLKWVSLLLNNVSELGASHLAEAVKLSRLEGFSIYATQLDLHDRCIGDKGTEYLARVLEHNTSLKSLCIGQSGVTNIGLGCILRTLSSTESKTPNITNLDLHSNLIDTDGAAAIAAFLVSATTTVKLKRLILDENHHIGNEGAREIALALCHNSSLEMLSMRSCSIGSKGGARFATTLSKNRSLKKLDLRGNVDIGDSAVELLARGLKENSCLKKLDLSSCGVGDEGCAGLADALLTNETLTHLKLHRNDISDGGLIALSEALNRNS
jgi:Ran GTPase-activating protein (RanGAP) involved in mRNA processing and transport